MGSKKPVDPLIIHLMLGMFMLSFREFVVPAGAEWTRIHLLLCRHIPCCAWRCVTYLVLLFVACLMRNALPDMLAHAAGLSRILCAFGTNVGWPGKMFKFKHGPTKMLWSDVKRWLVCLIQKIQAHVVRSIVSVCVEFILDCIVYYILVSFDVVLFFLNMVCFCCVCLCSWPTQQVDTVLPMNLYIGN